jgi:hypothetical protein
VRNGKLYRFHGTSINTTVIPEDDTSSRDKEDKNFMHIFYIEELEFSTEMVKKATNDYVRSGIFAFKLFSFFYSIALAALTIYATMRLVQREVITPVMVLHEHITEDINENNNETYRSK